MTDAFVLAADANFATPLGVVLSQLGALVTGATRVVVLHEGIPAEDRNWVTAEAGDRLVVEFVEITAEALAGVSPPAHLPAATLFRLLIGELVDPGIRRIVYLDVDLLLRRDPTPLFDECRSGLAAVRDHYRPWIGGRPPTPWREEGLAPDTRYLNAGVLAVDMSFWRDRGMATRCLDLLRARRLAYGDQDALNLALRGSWHELDPTWNVQTDLFLDQSLAWVADDADLLEAARRDPAIVHFTGPDKPWIVGPTDRFRTEWIDSLERTSRAGWRPSQPSRAAGMVRRVRRRVGRAVAGG